LQIRIKSVVTDARQVESRFEDMAKVLLASPDQQRKDPRRAEQ